MAKRHDKTTKHEKNRQVSEEKKKKDIKEKLPI